MSEPFIGEIRMIGFNFSPRNWAFCDGQILPINQNGALYALLGTTYGGDGRSTFGLPDLRGRIPMHSGQGPGLVNRQIGETVGTENVQMDIAQMPAHNHSVITSAPTANVAVTNEFVSVSAPTAQATVANDFVSVSAPTAQVNVANDFVTAELGVSSKTAVQNEPTSNRVLAIGTVNIYTDNDITTDNTLGGVATTIKPSSLTVTNDPPNVTLKPSSLTVTNDPPNVAVDPAFIAVTVGKPGVAELDTGGSQPHNNIQPSLVVNFIIALEGIFPPRS